MKYFTHPEDREIISIIKPNLKTGPWIAGGACIHWLNKKPVGKSDIDVFFANEQQMQSTFERLNGGTDNWSPIYNTANAITLTDLSFTRKSMNQQIQLIKCAYFNSAQEVIDNFDIRACQIVTDGFEYIVNANTISDIKNKILHMSIIKENTALKRFTKYVSYGFSPTNETLEKIYSVENILCDFSGTNEYDNAFTV